MTVKEIYPPVKRRRLFLKELRDWLGWGILFAGLVCVTVNLVTGGKAWSAVVVWSLWIVRSRLVSRDMVEFNRVSQFIKLVADAVILLLLIDILLAPGWAVEVVAFVCFGGLIVVGVLFFTDFERQRQNMLPMLLMSAACLIGSIVGLSLWREENRWALAIMGVIALSLLVACAVKLGGGFWRECKKRFCAK